MAVASDLPDLSSRAQFHNAQNSVIDDRDGNVLATLYGNQHRILLDSSEISLNVKQAVVSIEDQRFYEHRGVDFVGIGRAVVQDLLSQSAAQGGSTITEQFVKNALRAQSSRTVFQKLREAALAYQIEREWSKEKILTEYLNSIYFGEGAYGIEAAAKTYFGYNHPGLRHRGRPLRIAARPRRGGDARRDHLLADGLLAAQQPRGGDRAPQPGADEHGRAGRALRGGGPERGHRARPGAEPDPPPARGVRGALLHLVAAPAGRRPLRRRRGVRRRARDPVDARPRLPARGREHRSRAACRRSSRPGSAVVIDNKTGGVLAMVGGFDYNREPFNLATNGHRQPGSSFKPFTLLTALQQGHSTSEVFTSAPQQIPFRARIHKHGETKTVNDIFRVSNYEDNYLGSASIATATTYSDNSVYASSAPRSGPANVAHTANALGIQTDLSTKNEYSIDGGPFEPYNPALILGGLETGVTPLEMAYAYSTIGRHGQRIGGTMDSASPARTGPGRDRGGRRPGRRPGRGQPWLIGRQRAPDRPGDRRDLRRHRRDAAAERRLVGHRQERRDGRLRVGQDRHDRRQRRRLVLRRHRRTSPPASGSATATASPR